jgi:ankyrin repeat protein
MSGSQSTDALLKELVEFCHSDSLSENGLREIFQRYGCAPPLNINNDFVDNGFFLLVCKNEKISEEIIRYLLEYFPRAAATSVSGLTPLHTILFANKNVTRGMVQLLIDACPESPRLANDAGNTPLHVLCTNENIEDTTAVDILGLFLERCSEAAQRAAGDGDLPIHIAARRKSIEFCRMLIEAYPGSERIANSNGTLPFHIACGLGRVATAEYLYKLYPESINVADGGGRYPIYYAITIGLRSGNPATAIEMVQMLLNCDPNVASQMHHEFSPLLIVCMTGDVASSASMKILHLLYDAHPEGVEDNRIEAVDRIPEEMQNFIMTQRTYARRAKDPTFMTRRDVNGQGPLHIALRDNITLGSIKLLLNGDRDAIRMPNNHGALPLHVAIQHHKSTKVVDYLVGLDSDTLTAVDRGGNTALHVACHGAKYDTIELLLDKYGAVSVSKTNGHNKLPIHLLLESGGTSNREDDTKYTESIFRLLRAYPDTLMMSEDIEQQQLISESSTSHVGKKRKICTD